MSAVVIANVLQAHPFTEGFWPDHIARLSSMGSEAEFRAGEAIFREGDHSSFFYLLVSGNVALEVMSPGRAVRVAFSVASPGGTVLLAPACSSFDMFRDYAERGRMFKQEVERLREDWFCTDQQ